MPTPDSDLLLVSALGALLSAHTHLTVAGHVLEASETNPHNHERRPLRAVAHDADASCMEAVRIIESIVTLTREIEQAPTDQAKEVVTE